MEKKDIKINLKTAIICILLFVLCVFFVFLIFKKSNNSNNNVISNNYIDKSELKNALSTFTIRFSSKPYNTDVEYDFKNKTKKIIHYTSSNWEHTDEIVKYNRFDELYDYLYNTVFPNTENVLGSSAGSYGVVYAATEPYFSMFVHFNTSKEVSVFNSNWSSYVNSLTNLAGWTLNGQKTPSYWKNLLEILEIDNSILSSGTTYDFNM